MAILTIKISNKEFSRVKTYAKRAGFKNPAEWARDLVERNLFLEESPRMSSAQVIAEMKQTGRYKGIFLHGLKKSLAYADKAA